VTGYQGRPGFGFESVEAFAFQVPPGAGEHRITVDDVRLPEQAIPPGWELSYVLQYELDERHRYAGGCAALDVVFDDGTRLSSLDPVDQLGFPATPDGQGDSKAMYPHQWNFRRISLDAAAGLRAVAVELVVRADPDLTLTGWVDRVRFEAVEDIGARRPVERVLTTRGTNSNATFSRGNTIPMTAWPNGFAGYTPVTDARTLRWVYSWADHNDDTNRPVLQALAVTHQPSPWMGDRQPLQLVPQPTSMPPTVDPQTRGLPFSHDDEQAHPHHYRVRTASGIVAEVAPTEHAAAFRFTFPSGTGRIVVDQVDEHGDTSVAPDGTVTAWTEAIPGPRGDGAGRMHVYATADRTPTATGEFWTEYAVEPGSTGPLVVTVWLATSFISVDQARHNLALEIGLGPEALSFDAVADRAADAWDERLAVLEIPGAPTEAQLTTYGNLYRLNLYPSIAHENTGSNESPVWVHASPNLPDNPVLPGKLVVNHGFWDTFRTCWPAYALLYPDLASELVDGFVQHFRDGGWIPRWSSPGYADCMVGTSSDIAFADAVLKGIATEVDEVYLAALRNASAASVDSRMGRKSLSRSLFLGWTPVEEPEGLSWSMDGYLNDAALASLAEWLLDHPSQTNLDADQLRAEADWFRARSRDHRRLFHARLGFFIGRRTDGSWRIEDGFDPDAWGDDYTETNAWTASLSVPHDPAGLFSLYGGRSGLTERLEEFFSHPERADKPGSYGSPIHEMLEARDVRMGQYGHSNQPAHHIPFLWLLVGRPDRTQQVVREIMSRFHAGSEIGQGYGGDEDNGEMSAWHLFALLGIHPFPVGSAQYAIGSPLLGRVVWHRNDGSQLTVTAVGSGPYVAGLSIDGVAVDEPWLDHTTLVSASSIEFSLAAEPQSWGSAVADPAPAPPLLVDLPRPSSEVETSALTDDDAMTTAMVTSGSLLTWNLPTSRQVQLLTLTCGERPDQGVSAFELEAEIGGSWRTVASGDAHGYRWPYQTRPFTVEPTASARFRLTLGAGEVAEVQLLGPESP